MSPADIADHELAALAAGLRLVWKRGTCKGGAFCAPFLADTGAPWRPLDDDGDSRRLEVACRLTLRHYHDVCVAECGDRHTGYRVEPLDGDPLAAARRAVFYAAMDIGAVLVSSAPGGSRQPLFI